MELVRSVHRCLLLENFAPHPPTHPFPTVFANEHSVIQHMVLCRGGSRRWAEGGLRICHPGMVWDAVHSFVPTQHAVMRLLSSLCLIMNILRGTMESSCAALKA